MKPTMLSRVFVDEFADEIWGLDPYGEDFEREIGDVRDTYCAGWEL